jgi:hypothetical protein
VDGVNPVGVGPGPVHGPACTPEHLVEEGAFGDGDHCGTGARLIGIYRRSTPYEVTAIARAVR